jgi:PilZ domain
MTSNLAVGKAPSYAPARRWPRYKLDVPIRAIAATPGKTTIVDGRGRDISEGGMLIFAGMELQITDSIEVEFTPPFAEPIRVPAIVRNRNGFYYGVEFLRTSADDVEGVTRLGEVLRGMSESV